MFGYPFFYRKYIIICVAVIGNERLINHLWPATPLCTYIGCNSFITLLSTGVTQRQIWARGRIIRRKAKHLVQFMFSCH
jgi:hypothetical protein